MRTPFRRGRRRAAALVAATAFAAVAPVAMPTGALAGTQTTQNACLYSLDGNWRNLDLTLSGTASTSGTTVTVADLTLAAELPNWLPVYGYNLGFLQEGVNELPTSIWAAVAATGTAEGVQVRQLDVTARTTITVSGGTVTATPIAVDIPELADLTFTATGGQVQVAQAGPGTLPDDLPVGVGGAPVDPLGSVYISTQLGAGRFNLDCQPGSYSDEGGSFTPATAAPFASVGEGPGPVDPEPEPPDGTAHDCISGLGRYVRLEDGSTKEIAGLDLALATTADPRFGNGVVQLRGAQITGTIPAATVLELYGDSHGLLAVGDNTFPLHVWAAIAGTGTVETVQTVGTETTWTTSITDPTPGDPASGDEAATDVAIAVSLPTTTWTPAGTGEVTFAEAPAGSMSTIGVIGKGYADTPYQIDPYGSIFLRAETSSYGANLDCVAGDVAVADPDVRYSNLGRGAAPNGSAGRYAVTPSDVAPFLAVTVDATTPLSSSAQVVTVNVVGIPLQLQTDGVLVPLPAASPGSTVEGSLADVTVKDLRGTSAGWSLTGSMSELRGTAGTLPADAVGWSPTAGVDTEADPGGTGAVAPGSVAPGLATPQTLCSAPSGQSAGVFTCGGSLVLDVPASASVGTYTGTLTLTLV